MTDKTTLAAELSDLDAVEHDGVACVAVPISLAGRILTALTTNPAAPADGLREAALAMLPKNFGLTNRNIRDDFVVPLECTMGDLRRLAAALSEARSCCEAERERWPDDFIFDWFNERDPDEMRACLEAREKAATAIRGAD